MKTEDKILIGANPAAPPVEHIVVDVFDRDLFPVKPDAAVDFVDPLLSDLEAPESLRAFFCIGPGEADWAAHDDLGRDLRRLLAVSDARLEKRYSDNKSSDKFNRCYFTHGFSLSFSKVCAKYVPFVSVQR